MKEEIGNDNVSCEVKETYHDDAYECFEKEKEISFYRLKEEEIYFY